jgi:hypothetical protein
MFIRPVAEDNLPLPETNKKFIYWVLFAYIVVEITGTLFHSMWRDELHFWSLAGASSSLQDLLHRKAWDSHPDLWYIMLYAVRMVSDNPFSMQVLHSAIAITTVFLILKYAPFSKIQRGLLVFGYFFLFEYALISRNYAIGMLLITLLLILYPRRVHYLFTSALILFFLAQTNLFSTIICIAFLLTWIFEFIFSEPFRAALLRKKAILISGIILIVAGLCWAFYAAMLPGAVSHSEVSDFSLSQLTLRELIRSVATLWKAWVPIPVMGLQFWGTNFIRSNNIEAILALILMFSAGLMFLKRPVVFFYYIISLTGILGFIFLIFYGYIRHHGYLFIILVICLWLKSFYQENNRTLRSGFLEKSYGWLKKNSNRLLVILLAGQMLAGIYAFTVHLSVPFSAAKVTAQYIRAEKLDRFLIAGDQDLSLEPVIGYLDKEAFFFSRNAFSRYLVYDTARREPASRSAVLAMADSLLKSHGDTILLVMNYMIPEDPKRNLKRIQSFVKSIRQDEIYYLYLLSPAKNDSMSGLPRQ